MTNWTPDLSPYHGPKYLAIADSIGAAILSGGLSVGAKLPPQRNLAYDIGVTLGTVTRGYREAERRGLVGGEVGRGTYVLEMRQQSTDAFVLPASDESNFVNFGRAMPIQGIAGAALSKTLHEIADTPDIDVLANYQLNTGLDAHIEAGAHWLSGHKLDNAHAERIAITNGVHHGILVSLMTVADPGDVILVEPLTYPGILHLARTFGFRIETVATDDDGIIPEALDEACRRHAPRVLYCMPNLQNPTATILPTKRRHAIAEIVERQGLFVVEDDIWGPLLDGDEPHLANLIPDRTIYLTSLSKCMAGGLRIGYALTPERLTQRLRAAVRMSCWMPAPLMAEIARRWIMDGTGLEMTRAQIKEVGSRFDAGLKALLPYSPRHPHRA
ncbi:MAG: PLP-dependent aminotransferase family protein, partial [Rhodospirillales bacterium]|nr:PLP-dependent aminotransferase family protein [Rhodospirillales bacterium]